MLPSILYGYFLINLIRSYMSRNKSQYIKKISNNQDLIQSDPTSCPQNQKGLGLGFGLP